MKIFYIACGSGCDQTMGGSLARTVEIARRLEPHHKINILTTSGGKAAISPHLNSDLIIECKTPICQIHNEKSFFLKQLISYTLLIIQTLPKIFQLPKFDIVYLDSDGLWDIIPGIIYKLKNPSTKLISMNHHKITLRYDSLRSFIFTSINFSLQQISFSILNIFADAIFVLDTEMGDQLLDYYRRIGYKKNVFSVKDGVDSKLIASVPEQKKEIEACFFGYLRPSKGLYDIIPIWRSVKKTLPYAKLLIVGGMLAEYKEYLLNEIEKYDLQDNIIFSDYIPEKQKAIELIKKTRIFISPSHEEGWGISIMECLSSNLPGVVWDLTTYNRIFKEGLIKVNKFDIEAFAKTIVMLLTNTQEYIKLQSKTINSVKQFDWDNIAHEELNTFQKILLS